MEIRLKSLIFKVIKEVQLLTQFPDLYCITKLRPLSKEKYEYSK